MPKRLERAERGSLHHQLRQRSRTERYSAGASTALMREAALRRTLSTSAAAPSPEIGPSRHQPPTTLSTGAPREDGVAHRRLHQRDVAHLLGSRRLVLAAAGPVSGRDVDADGCIEAHGQRGAVDNRADPAALDGLLPDREPHLDPGGPGRRPEDGAAECRSPFGAGSLAECDPGRYLGHRNRSRPREIRTSRLRPGLSGDRHGECHGRNGSARCEDAEPIRHSLGHPAPLYDTL